MLRATCLIGAMTFTAVAIINVTLSAAVVDQINSDANHAGWDGISDTRWNGQSFSPDLALLTAVEFYGLPASHAWNNMPDGTGITAQVWSTSGGLPQTLLGSATRNTPLIPDGENWSGPFTFAAPIDVSAYVGDPSSLFLALTTPGSGGTEETTGWSNDTYADGAWFVSTDDGASWQINAGRDLVFRTWGDVIPEPSSLGVVAGMLVLALRRRKN